MGKHYVKQEWFVAGWEGNTSPSHLDRITWVTQGNKFSTDNRVDGMGGVSCKCSCSDDSLLCDGVGGGIFGVFGACRNIASHLSVLGS